MRSKRRSDGGLRLGLRERRHPVLQALEVAGERRADDVGPRRQELAKLHIGGPERGERRRKPVGDSEPPSRRSISRAMRTPSARRRRQRRRIDGPNTPSRANTKPARPRRTRWANAEITAARRAHSRQPECNATTPPVRTRWLTRRNPAAAIIVGKGLRPRKAADRFDEVAVGVAIARHRAAQRRDDVEGIEVVERIEAGHVDGREFEAEKSPAGPQHAIELAQRDFDPRHVADAEGDGAGVEAAVRKRQRFGIAGGERHRRRRARASRARSRPTASMSGLMSQTVTRGAGAARLARSGRRHRRCRRRHRRRRSGRASAAD